MKNFGEPEQLKRGKSFHKTIQKEWLETAKDGTPSRERMIKKLNGRNGRVDILVEELGDFVSIIEIKATDWDRMTDRNVRRNARRQIRQIWGYISAALDLQGQQVCPGIIFPALPKDRERLARIERLFNGEGIQVVWRHESMEHLMSNLRSKTLMIKKYVLKESIGDVTP